MITPTPPPDSIMRGRRTRLQITCPMCLGLGEMKDPAGMITSRLVTCSNCNGKGVLMKLMVVTNERSG